MKIWYKTNKFKDYIRDIFQFYTIVIVVLIFVLFIISLFFNFRTTIVKTNRSSNNSIGNFIDKEFNFYKKNIESLAGDDIIIEALTKKVDLWKANNLLYNYCNEQRIRGNFVLLDENSNIIATNLYKKNQDILSRSRLLKDLIEKLKDNPNTVFSSLNEIRYENNQGSSYLFSKTVKSKDNTIGYLIFYLKNDSLRKYVRYKDVDTVIITDKYDNVIFTNNSLVLNSMKKMNVGNREKNITIFNEQPYYIISNRIQNGSIQIVTMTSINKYRQFFIIGTLFLLGISFLIIILVAILSPKVIERNLKSFDSLIFAVDQLKRGNMEYRIEAKTFDEFQIIYDEFNNMTSKIQSLIQHNNEIAERKRIMEIKHLENQFNPHFVYNVMEMLRYEMLLDPELASNILVSFANLMRYSTNYGNVEVPLKMEIEYIEDYLKIQKIRFNKRLSYDIHMDPSMVDYKVPKLILQPIVENSLKHGIENTNNLNIQISIKKVGEDIKISVEDNGQGIIQERLNYLRNILKDDTAMPEHIGLYNVHRAIKLLYGDDYGLTINSEYGVGTKVVLKTPIIGDEIDA